MSVFPEMNYFTASVIYSVLQCMFMHSVVLKYIILKRRKVFNQNDGLCLILIPLSLDENTICIKLCTINMIRMLLFKNAKYFLFQLISIYTGVFILFLQPELTHLNFPALYAKKQPFGVLFLSKDGAESQILEENVVAIVKAKMFPEVIFCKM